MTTLTDSCGVLRLWNHFPRFQDNLLKLISTTHLLEYLDGRGIAYTEHCQPSRVDVTECFDETSEKGGRVLDALLHILRFRETASFELQAEVMNCLASCSEKSGSRVFLTNDWDAVVASKPAE
ncbi:histamine N-methyltransferase-like [Acanthaster planci]|uniref:Histamine N-methyltransferase-like n=1 Tax=Acanthaster planci TaxID=133434 RepID=A0A8B7XJ61_ACAPL|nr:histamine N-methyltransferase-like [Acanthaster planci]